MTSVGRRLDRLVARRPVGDVDRLLRHVAEEFGLGIAEVRAEWDDILAHARRFGPLTIAEEVRRCAERFGLAEAEVWALHTERTCEAPS